ncbi:molybdate ABC transporter substrate-binding protein [Ethanoligenens harbinense]|uniref:Molybdenum ABC transporter, periplasmic molybdate-binding protein n=1 Tax=Ethanoligenens harbinense (strain DSM 18485 / JCM 12961 / CGMCC 1.5033 / YUAN-3) TaxID=663278 RepID=E6U888_ETHHY|nr:molybdate ABC transporter substrate-binding protein [Ethanoligenens harbinense]ADU27107.1 molybdenum ABC transporter, periplasmic molybdate-binding protein [Ethanoligenens harbinense YUAN-3]
MKKQRILGFIAAAVLAATTLAGCSSSTGNAASSSATSSEPSVTLTVSAAASLTDVLKDVESAYKKAHKNVSFTNNFGASGTLQQQIQNGADADIFFSAAESNMDALDKAGLLLSGTRQDVVGNTIEFIIPKGQKPITSLSELTSDRFKQIAIGNPASVPAGKYAQQILTEQNIYNSISPKLVQGTDVRAVLNYVETGNAEGGFVFSTDAKTSTKVEKGFDIPASWQPKINYPAAVVKASKNADAAKTFVTYLSASDAQKIFGKYGFSKVAK